MKNSILISILLVSLTSCGSGDRERRGNFGNFEERQNRLLEELDLREDQREKVVSLFAKYADKTRDIREEFQGDREGAREKIMELNKERDEELKEILDDDQFAKWEEIRREFAQRGGRQARGTE